MYLRLENNVVLEIIPDIDPVFPGVPIEQRYPADFIAQLMHVEDDTEVEQNWVYDPETGGFAEPPEPEPPEYAEPEEPVYEEPEPTFTEAFTNAVEKGLTV